MTVWLLTWLWEGVALTLAVACLSKAERLNAATRHLIWWSALGAVIWLGYISSPFSGLQPIDLPGDSSGMNVTPETYLTVTEASPLFVSMFLGVWAAIALMKLLRLLPSLHAVYALRDRCRPFPASIEAQLPLWLEASARGRRTELMICDAVPGATVLGFQRPWIALPSSLVEALTADELDQIILHEHAHAQRRDDWVRLLQALAQAVLWIHPAVAFVGRALNREREMACDEWVVARTGLPKAYARCLTRAAEVRGRFRVEPLVGPALLGAQHDLVRRVNRLLAVKGRTRRHVSLAAVAVTVCAIVVVSSRLNAVPLIGEHVEMALPQVRGPVVRMASAAIRQSDTSSAVQSAPPVPASFRVMRRVASVTAEPAFAPDAHRFGAAGPTNTRTNEPANPRTDEPAFAPEAHRFGVAGPATPRTDEPVPVLSTRSFEAAYSRPDARPPSSDEPNVWRAAAAPGVEIANAARKTGVGIAGALSRASVSLARSF